MAEHDWSKTREGAQFVRDFVTHVYPQLKASAVMISICPGDDGGDAKFWVELGASIMLDKPILVLVDEHRLVPAKLAAVADAVVRGAPDDPATQERIREALRKVMPQ